MEKFNVDIFESDDQFDVNEVLGNIDIDEPEKYDFSGSVVTDVAVDFSTGMSFSVVTATSLGVSTSVGIGSATSFGVAFSVGVQVGGMGFW